jgi:RNA polymerase sigma factor (sigma-70 family)
VEAAVNRRFLQAVLRSLSELGPPLSDADLLGQFVAGGGEAAFAELVRRHGRLVWVVCRHLTGSEADAEDAFQATFLVLLQNAGKIRDGARLSAWLHGVAHKVCGKARQSAQRRLARERVCARCEGNGAMVPDSAWDRALAAVHEEAAQLPDTLRLPFVLCCLEGKGVSEAALQLRWKVGTLSARLARAKDAVLARLGKRGLTIGAVAGVGLAAPPAAVVARAAALPHALVPGSILELSKGVIGMSTKSMKLLATALLAACGLGLGVGSGWLGIAEAQHAPKQVQPADAVEKAVITAADRDDLLTLQSALLAVAQQQHQQRETYTGKTAKWEYDLVEVSDMGTTKFIEFLEDRETRGWEFNGQTTLRRDGKASAVWVFRRPPQAVAASSQMQRNTMFGDYGKLAAKQSILAKADDAKAIAAEIDRLQHRLQALKFAEPRRTAFARSALPLEPDQFADVLRKMLQKRFPGRTVTIVSSASEVSVEGDEQVRQWVVGLVKLLEP